jgi:hypothetical protein
MSTQMSTTENGWTAEDELRRIADLMKDEMASYPSQREIVHIALKALADKQSEVEQLTEELAGWRGRELQHCMERDMGRVDGTTAAAAFLLTPLVTIPVIPMPPAPEQKTLIPPPGTGM